jgi:hypothetical protein
MIPVYLAIEEFNMYQRGSKEWATYMAWYNSCTVEVGLATNEKRGAELFFIDPQACAKQSDN